MKGIDVSVHNGVIDWAKVKADGIDFAILRAGYGSTAAQKDKKFEANYAGATGAGLHVGAYWYSYATTPAQARDEAKACIEVLNTRQLDFPVWFDLEEKSALSTGRANCSAMIRAFCGELEKAGFWVGLYMSRAALTACTDENIRTRYAIWAAEWGAKLNYSGAVGMWQRSSTGRVSGISGNVDLDEGYVDYPAKIKAAGKNNFNASAPALTPPTRVLREGHVGQDVKWMQQQLQKRGHYAGTLSGVFDAETLKAVLIFQYRECLQIDGVCGPATRGELAK